MIDLLGFAGSGLIVMSLTMKSIVRLRVIGLCGSAVFVGYGLALAAWPIAITNCVTFGLHVFHLRSLLLTDRVTGDAATAGRDPQGPPAGEDRRTIRSHRVSATADRAKAR